MSHPLAQYREARDRYLAAKAEMAELVRTTTNTLMSLGVHWATFYTTATKTPGLPDVFGHGMRLTKFDPAGWPEASRFTTLAEKCKAAWENFVAVYEGFSKEDQQELDKPQDLDEGKRRR